MGNSRKQDQLKKPTPFDPMPLKPSASRFARISPEMDQQINREVARSIQVEKKYRDRLEVGLDSKNPIPNLLTSAKSTDQNMRLMHEVAQESPVKSELPSAKGRSSIIPNHGGEVSAIMKVASHWFRLRNRNSPKGEESFASILDNDPCLMRDEAMNRRQKIAIALGSVVTAMSFIPVLFAAMAQDGSEHITFIWSRLGGAKTSQVFYFPLIGVCFASALIYFSFVPDHK